MFDFYEYELISFYYKNQVAKRSGVPLINHINEGLKILDYIQATETSKKAFCLHPIFQDDAALEKNYHINLKKINSQTLICVIEYRSIANAYLSKKIIQHFSEIQLSPLKDVNQMLIADKVQNKKDFELYHKNTHPRSQALELYFNNWLQRLNINNHLYEELVSYCSST